MGLKSLVVSLLASAALAVFAQASADGERIFDQKCATCHSKTMPKDRSKIVAPPLFGIMNHVKMVYPKREDAIEFIVDYVLDPSVEKAVCMPQKIKRFGLMPSLKGSISKDELKKVSEWMYDNYPPKSFSCASKGCGQNSKGCRQNIQTNKPKKADFEDIDTDGDGVISKEEFDAYRSSRAAKGN